MIIEDEGDMFDQAWGDEDIKEGDNDGETEAENRVEEAANHGQ